jgi:hypothetical protein
MPQADPLTRRTITGDLSGFAFTPAATSVTTVPASVLNTPTATELHDFPPPPPGPKPIPIENWKPRLQRRVAELSALINAPEWFRCRFDPGPSAPGADNKISVWTNGYLVEYMQGHPCDSYYELHATEDEMLYGLFKMVAELMSLQRGQPKTPELLGRISREWHDRFVAEATRAERPAT